MGQLAHSADHRAARPDTSIPGMIQTALTDAVTPLSAAINTLAAMIEVFDTVDLEFEAETKEELLEVAEEASYEGLTETKEAMIDVVVQASLTDTTLVVPRAITVPSKETPCTDDPDQTDTPGTDA
uniref:Polyprotein protein n=1 Tax=Solanum tuberosum TaxID=4113 RepID=M1DGC8_SOLTU